MKKIAFLTYDKEPRLTSDDQLALDALARLDVLGEPIIWETCTSADFEPFDLIIFRSCWNYHLKIDRFRTFLKLLSCLAVPILNPLGLVDWNLDKKYLKEFEANGFRIPKTIFAEQGTIINLGKLLNDRHILDAVIKFDVKPEREFAVILEDDKTVQKWLRPAHNQFKIFYSNQSKMYEPDFVVQTEKVIYMVEVKDHKEVRSDDVQDKARSANQYCKAVNTYLKDHGGRIWKYLLVPDDQIATNKDFKFFQSFECKEK